MGTDREPAFIDFDKVDTLITSINPQISPKQAVFQVRKYHLLTSNEAEIPTIEARRNYLRENGYDPDEWVFYTNDMGQIKTVEEKIAILSRNFPADVEFLLLPGHFVGGFSAGQIGLINFWAAVKYNYCPVGHSAFIRVRSKQLGQNP